MSGHLHAIKAATGEVVWSGRTTGNPVSMAMGEDGVLHLHSFDVYAYTYDGNVNNPDAAREEYGHVTAFAATTGQPLWSYSELLMTSSILAEDGTVLVASPGGWVYALSPP